MDARARLTVQDVVYSLMSLAFFAVLFTVLADGLEANVGELTTGEAYLFQLIAPMAILVLMSVIWVTAVRGGA